MYQVKNQLTCGEIFLHLGASVCKGVYYTNLHKKIEERTSFICSVLSEEEERWKIGSVMKERSELDFENTWWEAKQYLWKARKYKVS